MAQANVVQDGIDQVRTAVRRADREFKKLQRQVDGRRKRFEKQAQKEIRRFERELRRQPVVKRVETIWKDASKQWEKGVDSVLDALPIATKRDMARIDRKITTINRKVRELEKTQAA